MKTILSIYQSKSVKPVKRAEPVVKFKSRITCATRDMDTAFEIIEFLVEKNPDGKR